MIDLAELQRLEAAATLGPWQYEGWSAAEYLDGAQMTGKIHETIAGTIAYCDYADGDFLVAARNAMPLLLAELTQLRALAAAVQAHRAAVEGLDGIYESERAVFAALEEWEGGQR